MKKITTYTALALFAAAYQHAYAHTTITDQGTEGSNLYTNISIPHGCGSEGAADEGPLPVEAQSVVFPNVQGVLSYRDDTKNPIPMSRVIQGAIGGLGVFTVRVIQDKNVYEKTEVIRNADELIYGIHYTEGLLSTDLTALLPIRATLGRFVPESCAKKVTANVGIANYCDPEEGSRRADIWIGRLTPVFNDPEIVSVGYWPQLVINRDLVNNPLPARCGAGFDVTIEPSDRQIDRTLPIDGFGP